ncbi:hypothetical protein ACO2I3_02655 [Leptospira interrogans]
MLGLDFQLGLARAWSDAVFGCMAACASASAAVINQAAETASADNSPTSNRSSDRSAGSSADGRSWYQPPVTQPFDISWFNLPTAFPMAWTQPMAMPFDGAAMWSAFQPWQAWATLLRSPFMTYPVPAAAPTWWTAFAAPPAPPTRPRTPQAAFATYRSESGHAVAQITFPNDVVAAFAVPPQAMALDTFFTWPATRH